MKRFTIAAIVVFLVFCVAFGAQKKKKPKYAYLKTYLSEPTGQVEFEALCMKASFGNVRPPKCTEHLVFKSMKFKPTRKGLRFEIVCVRKNPKDKTLWEWEHRDAWRAADAYFYRQTGCRWWHSEGIPAKGELRIDGKVITRKKKWGKMVSNRRMGGKHIKKRFSGRKAP